MIKVRAIRAVWQGLDIYASAALAVNARICDEGTSGNFGHQEPGFSSQFGS
jgi:hypothetical protein